MAVQYYKVFCASFGRFFTALCENCYSMILRRRHGARQIVNMNPPGMSKDSQQIAKQFGNNRATDNEGPKGAAAEGRPPSFVAVGKDRNLSQGWFQIVFDNMLTVF